MVGCRTVGCRTVGCRTVGCRTVGSLCRATHLLPPYAACGWTLCDHYKRFIKTNACNSLSPSSFNQKSDLRSAARRGTRDLLHQMFLTNYALWHTLPHTPPRLFQREPRSSELHSAGSVLVLGALPSICEGKPQRHIM